MIEGKQEAIIWFSMIFDDIIAYFLDILWDWHNILNSI